MSPSTVPTSHGVRCGNRDYHGTDVVYHADSASVRECFANHGRFAQRSPQAQPAPAPAPAPAPVAQAAPVTFAQFREANEFFDGELSHDEEMAAYQRYLGGFESSPVESLVSRVRTRTVDTETERKAAAAARYASWATIPVGTADYANYALKDGEHVRFYRVERPSKGQYAGKTYLKRYVSDDLVKTSWAEQGNALDAIAADPHSAAVLYGKETKRCGVCHRKLTDDKNKGSDGLTSLERGIGPKCAMRMRG